MIDDLLNDFPAYASTMRYMCVCVRVCVIIIIINKIKKIIIITKEGYNLKCNVILLS